MVQTTNQFDVKTGFCKLSVFTPIRCPPFAKLVPYALVKAAPPGLAPPCNMLLTSLLVLYLIASLAPPPLSRSLLISDASCRSLSSLFALRSVTVCAVIPTATTLTIILSTSTTATLRMPPTMPSPLDHIRGVVDESNDASVSHR